MNKGYCIYAGQCLQKGLGNHVQHMVPLVGHMASVVGKATVGAVVGKAGLPEAGTAQHWQSLVRSCALVPRTRATSMTHPWSPEPTSPRTLPFHLPEARHAQVCTVLPYLVLDPGILDSCPST